MLDTEIKERMTEKINLRTGVIFMIIALAAMSRFFPMNNFSPIAALGLFGGAYLSKKWLAFLLPMASILISDIILNNTVYAHMNEGFTLFYEGWAWQYATYTLIILLGILVLNKQVSAFKVTGSAIFASALFFLLSNFGTWASGVIYPMNLGGLAACYAAGVPFLKGTVMGDLFYSGVLFGGFHLLQMKFGILKLDPVRVRR